MGCTIGGNGSKAEEKIRTNIDLSQNFDTILDVSHLARWFTVEEINMFSQSSPDTILKGKKLAIIASSDIAYGSTRMYEGLAYSAVSFDISVFRDVSSALTWLGREGIDIESIYEDIIGEVR